MPFIPGDFLRRDPAAASRHRSFLVAVRLHRQRHDAARRDGPARLGLPSALSRRKTAQNDNKETGGKIEIKLGRVGET